MSCSGSCTWIGSCILTAAMYKGGREWKTLRLFSRMSWLVDDQLNCMHPPCILRGLSRGDHGVLRLVFYCSCYVVDATMSVKLGFPPVYIHILPFRYVHQPHPCYVSFLALITVSLLAHLPDPAFKVGSYLFSNYVPAVNVTTTHLTSAFSSFNGVQCVANLSLLL